MMRISILLLLFMIGRAQADSLAGGGIDPAHLTAVYSEALTFIAPRILEPVPVPDLTVWGLQGLSTLDPAIRVVATETRLQLLRHDPHRRIQHRQALQTRKGELRNRHRFQDPRRDEGQSIAVYRRQPLRIKPAARRDFHRLRASDDDQHQQDTDPDHLRRGRFPGCA